jgi:RimJ/RimL family protein N-acetyltransferase
MLGAFLAGLSEESRAFRFLSAGIDARGAGQALAAADGIGLLAFESDRLIGHACLIPTDPGTAEVAFAIADAEQGHGLATLLLERLVEAAERLGIQRLTAEVDPYNHHMVEVFEDCGLPVDVRVVNDVLHVEIEMDSAWAALIDDRTPARSRSKTARGLSQAHESDSRRLRAGSR